MKLRHLILLSALAVPLVLVVSAALLWAVVAGPAAFKERAFYAVAENAPRAAVIGALGQPDVVRACGESLWWGDDTQYRGKNDGRCVTEERYEYFLTAYGVGYSVDGRVVSKYRYVSE